MAKTRIATLGRERTIATLARKIYKIEAHGAADLQRRAEAALLSVNPRLSSADGFRAGASIVVPAIAGIEPTDAVVESKAQGAGLVAETAIRLQAAASRVKDNFASGSKRRKELSALLDDREFVAEARKSLPESAKALSKARERLGREEERSAEIAEQLQAGLSKGTEALKDLEAVARRLLKD